MLGLGLEPPADQRDKADFINFSLHSATDRYAQVL
jgi:hypothetical protein